MSLPPRPPPESFPRRFHRVWQEPLGRLVIGLSGLAGILAVGLVSFGILLFFPGVNPVVLPTVDQAASTLPADPLLQSGDVALVPSYPVMLAFNGLEYTVLPAAVADDGSLAIPQAEETAFWVYGTIVNYAFGFDSSVDNTSALQSIRAGDLLELTLGSGRVMQFRVEDASRHARSDASVFGQSQPGLTLFLAGGVMAERLVVRAQAEPMAGEAGGVASSVASTQTDSNTEVTLTSVQSVLRPGDLPAGWSYLLVDYQVTNKLQAVLDMSQMHQSLIDSAGQQYAPSLQGSQYASFDPLPQSLGPDEVVTATTAFLVPASVGGPSLLWRFFPQQSSTNSMTFTFPYQSLTSDLTVEITSAVASADGGDLVLNGLVFNPSSIMAVIDHDNVRLLTSAGEQVKLRFSDPAFEWRAGGGQTTYFTLTYVMPASKAATFTLFDYSFSVEFQ